MPIEHTDVRRIDYPHYATPESAVSDYLGAVLKHVSEVLKYTFGAVFESMIFTYVITVPAIWSDRAKLLTLEGGHRMETEVLATYYGSWRAC